MPQIKKNRREVGLKGKEVGEEQSSNFWLKTGELTRLSDKVNFQGE